MSKRRYGPPDGLSDIREIAASFGTIDVQELLDLQTIDVRDEWEDLRDLVLAVPKWARDYGSLASSLTDVVGQSVQSKRMMGIAPDLRNELKFLGATNRALDLAVDSYAEQALRKAGLIDPDDYLSWMTRSIRDREVAETREFVRSMAPANQAADLLSSLTAISSLGVHTSGLLSQSTLSSSSRFAEQWATSITALAPRRLRAPIARILEDIDLDPFRALVVEVCERIGTSPGPDGFISFDVIRETIDRASLENVPPVFVEAATAALRDTIEERKLDAVARWLLLVCLIRIVVFGILPPALAYYALSDPGIESSTQSAALANAPGKPRSIIMYAGNDSSKILAPQPQLQKDSAILVSMAAVKLRRGPHTTQSVIATVPTGQLLYRRKVKKSWSLVSYVDPQGDGVSVTGWLQTKYTSPLEEETKRMILCRLTEKLGPDEGCEK